MMANARAFEATLQRKSYQTSREKAAIREDRRFSGGYRRIYIAASLPPKMLYSVITRRFFFKIKNNVTSLVNSCHFIITRFFLLSRRRFLNKTVTKKWFVALASLSVHRYAAFAMIQITNIVVQARLNVPICLQTVIRKIRDPKYQPKRFSAICWNHKKIGGSCLLFNNGKMVCHARV